MAILGFEVEEIAQLLALLEANRWDELIVEEEGRTLRIRGPRPQRSAAPQSPPSAMTAPERTVAPKALPAGKRASAAKAAEPAAALSADQVALVAPMVGVFYRADKPGASPLVNIGDPVTVGQPIGIIEAMKIFSEIPAEHAGIVVAIPAEDGQLVQTGTPLFILQTVA
jgi:acetyl-CoA carboxylase biotin carboxyl carrier protein